jgi:putative transposase
LIAHVVWLYFRFPLSLRLVEEMLLERGIVVSYETIRCWAKKFGPDYAGRLRRKTPSQSDAWHLDEVVVTIGGRRHWLWRAVDQHGYVLDEIVQTRRNTKAAKRLLIPLMKKQGALVQRSVCASSCVDDGFSQFAFALPRTDSGRPQASIRLRTATPMATSVC